ncbi:hypothetical protein D3C71_1527420 [compost metagenome]
MAQGHELDVLDARIAHRAGDDARPAGHAGQQVGGGVQRLLEVAALPSEAGVDLAPLVLTDVPDLQQTVDEQAQPRMGRHPPRRGVRRGQQAGQGQILHGVADRGRRQGQPSA